MSVIVRRAGRRDLDAIRSLWRTLREHEAKLDPRLGLSSDAEAIAAEHREIILADPRTALFVAEERGAIVAYLHAQIDANDPSREPARYGTIVDLIVSEERRREGIAGRLLGAAREWLDSHAVAELRVTLSVADREARAFLEDRGARRVAARYVLDSGDGTGSSSGSG
ncbi:MAG: GNAT family N-acetyltransferase [Myxococcota bacterium]